MRKLFPFGVVLGISFAIMTAIPLAALSGYFVESLQRELTNGVHNQQKAELALIRERTGSRLLNLRRTLANLASIPDITVAIDNPVFAPVVQRFLEDFLNHHQEIESIQVTDLSQLQIMSATRNEQSTRWQRFTILPAGDQPIALPPRILTAENDSNIFLIAPVVQKMKDIPTRISGYTMIRVNLGFIAREEATALKRRDAILQGFVDGHQIMTLDGRNNAVGGTLLTSEDQLEVAQDHILKLQLSDPKNLALAGVHRSIWFSVELAAGLVALSLLAGWWISTRLIRSIVDLRDLANQYALGNYSRKPAPTLFREFAAVGHAFSVMMQKISEQISDLKRVISHLDALATEGRKIASAVGYGTLAAQLEDSFREVAQAPIRTTLYLSGFLLKRATKQQISLRAFFSIRQDGSFDTENPMELQTQTTPDSLLLLIEHGASGDIIGYLKIEHLPQSSNLPKIVQTMRTLIVNVATTIKNIDFHLEQKEQQRIHAELETARLVQKNLVPAHCSMRVGSFEIAGHFNSMRENGGDWWNYFPLHDGRLLILLGDVTEQGTPGALLTAVVKGYCDSLYLRDSIDPARLLRELNVLVRTCNDSHQSMTLFACLVDPNSEEIQYSIAGRSECYLLRNEKSKFQAVHLSMNHLPLGILDDPHACDATDEELQHPAKLLYENAIDTFGANDFLVVFANGMKRPENTTGQASSCAKHLEMMFMSLSNTKIKQVREGILGEFKQRCQDLEIGKTPTFFVLRRIHPGMIVDDEVIPPMHYFTKIAPT